MFTSRIIRVCCESADYTHRVRRSKCLDKIETSSSSVKMAFQITSASSTRKSLFGGRRTSSPLTSGRPQKTSPSLKRKATSQAEDDEEELFSSRLEDVGLINALATDQNLRDVPQQLQYAQDHMFEEISQGGGFNSTRISEILNWRKNLPPIVTTAHVQALSKSPTLTQREVSELVGKGVLRKINIPGRGTGRFAIGESLVLTERWIAYVDQLSYLESNARRRYIEALRENPGMPSVPSSIFAQAEASALMKAGLLTAASTSTSTSNMLSSNVSSTGTLASLSTAGSRAAAGSVQAVGGGNAFMDAGGGGGGFSNAPRSKQAYGPELTFTLPSVGPYLRLVEAARTHLVSLLSQSAYKEAPKDLLRERWDGSVTKANDPKRKKGFEGVVLPARTKKWKQFNGLKFQWVLEECLGTGLIEIFETGSVGQGVRLT